MKKILLIAAALALTACGGEGGVQSAGTTAPTTAAKPITPLGNTRVDDEAIVFAYRALSTTAKSINVLIAAKLITPGSPRANALADGLEGTLTWLDRASSLQKKAQAAAGLANGVALAIEANTAWEQAKAGLANLDLNLGSGK